mgnify:CR=1 FL=1
MGNLSRLTSFNPETNKCTIQNNKNEEIFKSTQVVIYFSFRNSDIRYSLYPVYKNDGQNYLPTR